MSDKSPEEPTEPNTEADDTDKASGPLDDGNSNHSNQEDKTKEIDNILGVESSDSEKEDESKEVTHEPEPDIGEFYDFCLQSKIVGASSMVLGSSNTADVYCGSCQKDITSGNIELHLMGDGHKLNTLWNYDNNLAEVAGELRTYPAKFEIEMLKHLKMLNRFERRNKVDTKVQLLLRSLFPEVAANSRDSQSIIDPDTPPEESTITPEELVEMKAEFIGSFPDPSAMMMVQHALLGQLSGFNSTSEAVTALNVVGMLGRMVCVYQRKAAVNGYKVNKECIYDIKEQCSRLLKQCDEYKLKRS